MSLPTVTDQTFDATVLQLAGAVLVEFTAQWCPPCRMIAPVLARIAADEADRLRVVALDVDADPVTAARFEVLGMPTLVLFVDGEPVVRFVGARSRTAILDLISPYLPVRTSV